MWSSLFFYCDGPHRHLHSFPTRRSSDLCMPLVRGPQNWLTGTRYDSGDPMSGNVANCSPPSSGNFDSPELAVISESIDVLSRGVPHWRPLTFAVVETRKASGRQVLRSAIRDGNNHNLALSSLPT